MKAKNLTENSYFLIDRGVAQTLEIHNKFRMDEVELFVEQVPIDLKMNSPIGNCIHLIHAQLVSQLIHVHLVLLD